jgi:hypothetical protein
MDLSKRVDRPIGHVLVVRLTLKMTWKSRKERGFKMSHALMVDHDKYVARFDRESQADIVSCSNTGS